MNKSIYVQRLDIIQSDISKRILKPNGFKKKGRTHNRITIDNLIQVIKFQIGQSYYNDNDKFFVHIGIRVPESFEKTFDDIPQTKDFYQDYECNIRTSINEPLGHTSYKGYNAKYFLLSEMDYQPIIDEIVEKIENYVFPLFSDLDTREKIIKNRMKYHTQYKNFELNGTYDLDEAMIYGRNGNIDKATELIQNRYNSCVLKYHKPHQDYLEKLSEKLGIVLDTSKRLI